MNLDQIDLKIIECLRRNARCTNVELGEQVGLSASACARRIQSLEEEGIIRGYTAVINTSASEHLRPVFLRIKLASSTEDCLKKFEKAIRTCAEVRECFLVTGASDYLLRIEISGFEDFERIHKEVLTRLPGVSSIESSFIIRNVFSYK
ncbi:Lrp/AsnC family transcriptional regulator [Pandoraea anhela]|uniref:ArsR family transcriptional regulator n=1 Tax=Pandoraea anhela TaxID=2508295 RepID=A0A5E4VWE3_9BURK|nr:Lrp/AsnC family transcriptional regulator [Pandoraea anhela]VVE16772.1 ArsR family transcriptional regulator [Pandoraea anhela]